MIQEVEQIYQLYLDQEEEGRSGSEVPQVGCAIWDRCVGCYDEGEGVYGEVSDAARVAIARCCSGFES